MSRPKEATEGDRKARTGGEMSGSKEATEGVGEARTGRNRSSGTPMSADGKE